MPGVFADGSKFAGVHTWQMYGDKVRLLRYSHSRMLALCNLPKTQRLGVRTSRGIVHHGDLLHAQLLCVASVLERALSLCFYSLARCALSLLAQWKCLPMNVNTWCNVKCRIAKCTRVYKLPNFLLRRIGQQKRSMSLLSLPRALWSFFEFFGVLI